MSAAVAEPTIEEIEKAILAALAEHRDGAKGRRTSACRMRSDLQIAAQARAEGRVRELLGI